MQQPRCMAFYAYILSLKLFLKLKHANNPVRTNDQAIIVPITCGLELAAGSAQWQQSPESLQSRASLLQL